MINEILEDFEDFIELGSILTKEDRKELIKYIVDKISRKEKKINTKTSKELKPYLAVVDHIFSNELLVYTCYTHIEIAKDAIKKTILMFKKAHKEFQLTNIDNEELLEYNKWKSIKPKQFYSNSTKILSYLKKIYSKKALDISFYEKKIEEERELLLKNPKRLAALKDNLLNSWNIKLTEKMLKHELQVIDDERKKLCEDLYKKIENFKKLKQALLPFTRELGRLWDLSSGVWQRTDFQILNNYAQYLEKEKSIAELAELLGRMRKAETELEEEEVEKAIIETEWKVEHAAKSELVGIHESDELSHVVPSEITLLSDPMTETIFFKKYADKKLLTFEFQGKTLNTNEITIKETQEKKKPIDKGPFIICIDTSGSMHGTPEYIAKLFAFAILRIALKDKRKCYLISFSTSIQTLDLTDLQYSIERLINFLSMSFHGGTDVDPALYEAVKQLKTKNFKNADVIVVSDFIMGTISEDLEEQIIIAKKNNTKFHSLIISTNANPQAITFYDNNWIYDYNNPDAIKGLVKNVRKITDREFKIEES